MRTITGSELKNNRTEAAKLWAAGAKLWAEADKLGAAYINSK